MFLLLCCMFEWVMQFNVENYLCLITSVRSSKRIRMLLAVLSVFLLSFIVIKRKAIEQYLSPGK